jgi:hypothetical protein
MARGRNVINQSIALEGGDEIVAMLRKMGEEGETAARKLEAAFRNVSVGKSFGSAFANLKSQFAGLQAAGSKVTDSFGRVGKSLGNVSGAFQSSTARIGIFTASLTGAAYGAGAFLKGSLDSLGQLNDLSESLGIASEDLQAFQYAGVQAGVGAGDFVKAIASLSDTLNELNTTGAYNGMVKLGNSFTVADQNGVKIYRGIMSGSDAAGKATDKLSDKAKALSTVLAKAGIPPGTKLVPADVLKAIADSFAGMKDGAEKTQLAIDLLSPKLGPKLIPFLNQGGTAIENYKGILKSFNALVTNEGVKAADAAGDQLAVIGFLFGQYRNVFTSLIAPGITKASDAILGAIAENSSAINAFITGAAESFVSVVQDLITMATGGPDAAVRNQWIIDLRDGFIAAGTAARDLFDNVLVPAFQAIRTYAQPVAEQINRIFGMNLSGDQLLIVAAVTQLAGGFRLMFSVLGLGVNSLRLVFDVLGLIAPLGKVISGIWPVLATGVRSLLTVLPQLAVFLSPAGLIAVGVVALGALLYTFWDEIVAGAKAAFAFLQTVFSAAWDGIKAVTAAAFEGVRTIFTDTWAGLTTAATAAFEGLKAAYADLWMGLTTIAFDARLALITVMTDTWTGITSTVAMARDGVFMAASQTWSAITEAASGVAMALAPVWQGIVDAASTAFSSVATLVVSAWSGASQSVAQSAAAIRDAIATATDIAGDVAGAEALAAALVQPFINAQGRIREITGSFQSLVHTGFNAVGAAVAVAGAAIQRQIAAIISALQRAVAEAARLRAQASSSSGSKYASGGYVRGAGSATSDSIPAWLSNGEFIIRAAAVKRYGVDFLRAINGLSAGPVLKGGFPGFALGGPVSVVPPALNSPGAASGRPIVLTLGEQSFQMVADNDVAEKLVRYSARRRVNSAGRKPSWYGA